MLPQIPQFNAFNKVGPFKFNEIYNDTQSNEANLYLNQFLEFCYLYGTDIVFIEMEFGKPEEVFGEYIYKKISNGTPMRLFVEETEGWGGSGDMYTKFGISTWDECSLYCPKTLFEQARPGLKPRQGDLIYINKSNKLFEIQHIEDETPPAFYLLGNKNIFKISCKTYNYDHTEISNDVNSALPPEVLALDNIFKNINNEDVSLHANEIKTNNTPIKTEVTNNNLIDNTEIDPLAKGR